MFLKEFHLLLKVSNPRLATSGVLRTPIKPLSQQGLGLSRESTFYSTSSLSPPPHTDKAGISPATHGLPGISEDAAFGEQLTYVGKCVCMASFRGVDKFFKTIAKLASSSEILLAKSGNNWPKI
jgi:hypothetical protein